ncbi:HTH domain protein [Clostridium tepidiprofundi DSM 19306]|uniref:HTH domain protein n=1 Tax=Clostridium tepidiprofundi DSM 19306 TaxID=1121338 RepID=A0A151B2T0_9CLOT|nr:HTH domain-containing protein [Clostridium tepidiprofundi]KYH34083.1 HTH domain protein [Clostridium tepidiprofundi DSM 19306]
MNLKMHNNILRMINLLNENDLMTSSELAKELDVDDRTVRRYKNYIKGLKINIITKVGRNGGYYILK